MALESKYVRFAAAGLALVLFGGYAGANDLPRAGWIEKAMVYPQQITLHAKLDTGAKTSSLHAAEPQFIERGNDSWVRFDVTNRDGDSVTIEAPVVRHTKIKRHFGGSQTRPVIILDLCIGNVRKSEEVNLVDRTGLNYQLLIGRKFLEGALLVDSGATYSLSPDCSD